MSWLIPEWLLALTLTIFVVDLFTSTNDFINTVFLVFEHFGKCFLVNIKNLLDG